MGRIGELSVSKVNDLIEDFIYEYKVLADDFFVDDSTKVFYDDNDSVEELEDVRWRSIEPGCGHNIDGGLFEIGEIDALNIKDGLGVPL